VSEAERILDVRNVHPRERHPLIFRELDALAAGDALLLVNDHDPRPLYYELMAERPGQFDWTPVQQGPETWSVRIRRLGAPGEPRTVAWLREEHRALAPRIDELAVLASRLSTASWSRQSPAVRRALDFLRSHLLPHARLEEEVIYPAVERGLGAVGAAATMVRDHREVESLTMALAEAAGRADARADEGTVEEAKRLLYSLHALLRVHFAKEEEVYVPVLQRSLTPEEDERAMAVLAIHEGEGHEDRAG